MLLSSNKRKCNILNLKQKSLWSSHSLKGENLKKIKRFLSAVDERTNEKIQFQAIKKYSLEQIWNWLADDGDDFKQSHPLFHEDSKNDKSENEYLKEIIKFLSTASLNVGTNETEKYSLEEIRTWLEEDDGLKVSDHGIVAKFLQNDKSEEGTTMNQTLPKVSVLYEEALSAFSTCIKWAEERHIDANECLLLQKLREKVFEESFSTCIKWAEERNIDANEYLLLQKLQKKVIQESIVTKN